MKGRTFFPNIHPEGNHLHIIRSDPDKEINSVKLLADKFKQLIIFKHDVSPALLQKIQDGAKKSKRVPAKFKKYFDKF